MRRRITGALVGLCVCGLLPATSQAGTRHRGWHSPVAISRRGSFSQVALAVNARGEAIAVWDRSRISPPPYLTVRSYALEAALKPARGSWRRPVVVTSVPGGCPDEACSLSSLSVAIGPRGQAAAVWPETEYDGPGPVWAVSRTAGGHWQAPVVLDPGGGTETQVVMDSHGNATAIWIGSGNSVRVASQPAGGAWGLPVTLGAGYGPQLGVDANGDLTAAWQSSSPLGGAIVQSASRPAGGSWGQPVTLTRGTPMASGLQIALDPHGDAIAGWENENLAGCACSRTLEAAFRPAGKMWRAPVTVTRVRRGMDYLQLALARRGRATAVWSDDRKVRAVSSSPDASWRAPVTIARPHAMARNLQLAGNAMGDTLAVWLRPFSTPFAAAGVKGVMKPAQGGWRRAFTFPHGSSSEETSSPAVGLDADGDAVVAWVHRVGGSYRVEAATFTRR